MTARPPAKPGPFTLAEWGLVLILAAINFVHILDFVIVMPLGDRLRNELDITPRQFGHIVSAYGLCATIAGLIVSSVVDRFDRRHVLLYSFAGFILATIYCGAATDYEHLLLARGLAGTFGGVAGSGIMSIIGDAFADARRGRAIGVTTSAFAVASIAGLPAGLALANAYGRGAPFYAIGGLSAIVLAVAWFRLPSFASHRVAEAEKPIVQFFAVVKQPRHIACFAFMFALVLGTFTVIPYIAPYMQSNCGRSEADIPIIYSIAGCCTLASMIAVGIFTDRVGQWPVFLVFAGMAIVMCLVITNLPPVGLIGGILAATGFMVFASGRIVPAQAMMLRIADPNLRGAFTNLNSAVQHLATGVAPLISGRIVGEEYEKGPLTNYPIVGLIAAGFGFVAIGLSLLLRPAKAQSIVPTNAELRTLPGTDDDRSHGR